LPVAIGQRMLPLRQHQRRSCRPRGRAGTVVSQRLHNSQRPCSPPEWNVERGELCAATRLQLWVAASGLRWVRWKRAAATRPRRTISQMVSPRKTSTASERSVLKVSGCGCCPSGGISTAQCRIRRPLVNENACRAGTTFGVVVPGGHDVCGAAVEAEVTHIPFSPEVPNLIFTRGSAEALRRDRCDQLRSSAFVHAIRRIAFREVLLEPSSSCGSCFRTASMPSGIHGRF